MSVEELVKGYRDEVNKYCDKVFCVDCDYFNEIDYCHEILLYSMLLTEREKVKQLSEALKKPQEVKVVCPKCGSHDAIPIEYQCAECNNYF